MTRKDLKRAYDSMNPTREEKERMLRAILEQAETAPEEPSPKERIHYKQQSPEPEKRRVLPLIAACLALVLLGSVFVKWMGNRQENPVAVEPTVVTEFAENPYQELLEKYALAIAENWTPAQCTEAGFSSRTPIANEYDGLYYAISDLDGDGTEELVITQSLWEEENRTEFLDLYTLKDGKPELVCSDRKFLRPILYENGVIMTPDPISMPFNPENYSGYYRLKNGSMELEIAIYQKLDEEWCEWDPVNQTSKKITAEMAGEIIAGYGLCKLELHTIAEPGGHIQTGNALYESHYDHILAKYETAIAENWSAEQCEAADISVNVPYANGLGWCLMDIDGNGTEELLIADSAEVYDLYTLMPDNLPGHILMSWGSNSYQLCEGGIIEMREYYSKGSGWFWMELDGIDLVQKDMLHYTNFEERDQYSYGPDSDSLEGISHEEAGELIFRYKTMELELTLFPERQVIDEFDEEAMFKTVMENYGLALKNDWDPGKCMEGGISLMIGYHGELYDSVGFAFLDLDGDGIDELLVTDGNYIYDLYSFINTEEDIPVRIFSATERSTWMLVQGSRNRGNEGSYLYNHGSGGAGYSSHVYYRLQEGNLIPVEGFLYDAEDNPENPWFYYDGFEKGENCADFDAEAVVNGSYSSDVIDFIPLED